MWCDRLGASQDCVGVGVDDNGHMRTMAGKSHAEPPGVGGEVRRFAVAGERMDDHDGLALESLSLIGGADQHTGYVGQPRGYGTGLFNVWTDHCDLGWLQPLGACMIVKDEARS
jgi:hypothetical protein